MVQLELTGTETVSPEDKMIAMFSHLSIFFGSLILPLVLWLLYKDKSKFITFHALQSLFFHIAYTVVMIFVVIVVSVIGVLTGLITKSGSPPTPGAFQIIIIIALGVFVLGYVFGSIGYAVFLAVDAYKGGVKKYPVIGNIIYKKVYGSSHV